MAMVGRGRDILTGRNAVLYKTLDEARFDILATPRREILEISCEPAADGVQRLVGARAGGHSRAILSEALADEKASGAVVYQLIDDFAGASLVAGWAWSRWTDRWAQPAKSAEKPKLPKMVGICAGFRPGASSLTEEGTPRHDIQSATPVPELRNPDDPEGLHEWPEQEGVGMRRARWIDVWREGGGFCVHAGFQDSATAPGGGRVAVHEYRLTAQVDAQKRTLQSVQADPRILPYAECPAAALNIQRLTGESVSTLRRTVIEALPGTLGCTHLNDVLRALADLPRALSVLE